MAPIKQKKPYARPRASDGHWAHDRAPLQATKPNAPPSSAPNTKLIVSNLHYEITPKDLVSIFGQIGTLVREPLIRNDTKTEPEIRFLKYDRSGRSSGVAIISFETPSQAAQAKAQFDGKIAKGQPMEIAFDTTPTRPRSTSMGGLSTSSLLSRIERPSLAERLSGGGDEPKRRGVAGPIRTRPPRSARNAPPSKTRAPKPARSKVPTMEQLDQELDVFMGDDKGAANNGVGKAGIAVDDVEMA